MGLFSLFRICGEYPRCIVRVLGRGGGGFPRTSYLNVAPGSSAWHMGACAVFPDHILPASHWAFMLLRVLHIGLAVLVSLGG